MLPSDGGKPLFPNADAPEKFLTQSDKVLQTYFKIQKALAGDSLDEAKSAAEDAAKQLSIVSVDTLSESSSEIWKNLAKRIGSSFQSIGEAKEIEPARTEFQKLTTTTDEMVRRFGTAHLPVYEHYCPMAFDNAGGTWLQPDENLLNPYFGSSMLKCGEVRHQLATAKSIPLKEAGNQAVKAIVNDYLAIQAALTKDSLEEAVAHANALASSATTLAETAPETPDAALQLKSLRLQICRSIKKPFNS